MRPLPLLRTGVIACLLVLTGCTSEQTAPTAPSLIPLFRTSPISTTHQYRFTLTCTNAAANSSVTVSAGGEFFLRCGETTTRGPGTGSSAFSSFSYFVVLADANSNPILGCQGGPVASTGRYVCKDRKWSATLKVTDLGESSSN